MDSGGVFEEGVVRGEGGLAGVAVEGEDGEVSFLLVALDHPTSGELAGTPEGRPMACWQCEGCRCRENGPP